MKVPISCVQLYFTTSALKLDLLCMLHVGSLYVSCTIDGNLFNKNIYSIKLKFAWGNPYVGDVFDPC